MPDKKNTDESISLNKYISSTGFCSRREADKLIEQARVTVNGKLVVESIRISPTDKVEIDGEKLKPKKQPIYIAFNKPKGITCTTDPKDKGNIIYYIGYPKRIFPIGRLDKDSEGLIFLTNDGDIVNKILRAANNHEKEYVVTVNKPLAADFVRRMSEGIPILGTVTKKCLVRQEGQKRFRIVLTQGLNRQIRRMCEYLDYRVVTLVRTRIMNVTLANIPLGKWRYLTQPEIETINKLVSASSKTEEASYEEKPKPVRKERPLKSVKKVEKGLTSEDAAETSKKKPTSYKEFRKRKK
jgi:23S rRNA pseudouridine2604 synthase